MHRTQTTDHHNVEPPTVMSVFGVDPVRIGGTEMFARELSLQLAEIGWHSVLCFLSEPVEHVRKFLDLPNVSLETLTNSTNGNWRAGSNLMKLANTYQPQVLHLHFVSFLSFYPWIARLKSIEKIFFTDHHSRPAEHIVQRAPVWKRTVARVIGWPYTKVYCVSKYGYECMTGTDLLPQRRFEMIYNGVDLSRVNPDLEAVRTAFRKRYSIPEDSAIVAQVSWIIPEKGIGDFLQMARLVASRRSDAHFVLVGDGKDRPDFMRQAETMGIANRITWTGTIDDPFSAGVFAAADVVCQFSRWEEVFGWMIAEAMAHAKPVVATRVGGIPELITDGESGFLVNRGDTEAMGNRVLDLLNDSESRARMGQAGRRRVEAKFDLSKNVARLIRSYGEMFQRPDLEKGSAALLVPQSEPSSHYSFNQPAGRI